MCESKKNSTVAEPSDECEICLKTGMAHSAHQPSEWVLKQAAQQQDEPSHADSFASKAVYAAAIAGAQQAEPVAEIRHRNGHPYAAMRKAYDADGNTLAEGTLLYAGSKQAEPVGDERAAYHVEHRTNMCSEVVDAHGNVYAECSWSTKAAERAQRVCDALNAAQSGQRAGVGESLADKIRAEVRLVLTDPEINLTPGAHRALRYVLSLLAAAPTPAAQGGDGE